MPAQVGELVLVEGGAGPRTVRRLVLVTRVRAPGAVTVMLCTNEWEQATDLDLILRPDETGLPYLLMVEVELELTCYTDQVRGSALGRIPAWAVDALARAHAGMFADGAEWTVLADLAPPLDYVSPSRYGGPSWRTGLPLRLGRDPRRAFKEGELDEWKVIAGRWYGDALDWLDGERPDPPPGVGPEDLIPC